MNPESLDLESSYFLVYLFSLEHYNCKCVTISHSVMPNSLWPKDCSLPSISVYGILQARILKWVVILSPGLADSLHLSHQGSPKILSVQFSHPVVSNCLLPHGVQHVRAPCPSPTPGVYSNSCPLSQWCHPTISSSVTSFSSCLQSFPVSNESVLCIRWPEYWCFSFSISPSNEFSRLISLRMDWLSFLAVRRTLKSLLQHHSSKASIFLYSAFFIVQISHPYMTTGKTIALTKWTFVG